MQRFLFTLQYLGTRYAGWQAQKNATGIQQIVEEALTRMCAQPVRVEGAGRTDSGVHAFGQRAHADIPIDIDSRGLMLGTNDLLPSDVRIVQALPVDPTFHARFDAVGKTYMYQIWNAPAANVFRAETHAHVRSPLDINLMREAAMPLLGEHDFRSFTVLEPEVSSTTRRIDEVRVEGSENVIRLIISADGFLRFMVRRIAGSLIEIGRKSLAADAIARGLEPEYGEARWTAPAEGLVLVSVRYPGLSDEDPSIPFTL